MAESRINVHWCRVDPSLEDLAERRHTDLFEGSEHLSHLYPDSPHSALFPRGEANGISQYLVAISEDRRIEMPQIPAEFGTGRCNAPTKESV